MIRFLYNLLFPLALLVVMPGYFAKLVRRGNYRHKFGERFGLYGAEVRARVRASRRTWIHAVSVGEVAIALKLARKLKQLDPAFACVLTTTTSTGFAVAEQEPIPWLQVMYNPLDFYPIMRRAFALIRPVRLILVEAEVWPNLVALARSRAVPIALVNARLSRRSERRFHCFRRFVAPTFRCLDLVCVQEEEEVARWAALGIARERIEPVGSVKFDPAELKIDGRTPREILRTFGISQERPILFGGSTHAGEEEILGCVFQKLRPEFPRAMLLIAPRHVERVPEIRARLEALGLAVALRSETTNGAAVAAVDCLLLDTTGELQDWYSVATIVFIGKSLTAHGGQNPVEPILAQKPVLFGPSMENFSVLAHRLIARAAAVQVADAHDLEQQCARLLRDDAARSRLVENAAAVIAPHRGATERTAVLIQQLRSAAASSPDVGK